MTKEQIKTIYICPDGYPSCRKAEAIGEFCKGKCECEGEIKKLKMERTK